MTFIKNQYIIIALIKRIFEYFENDSFNMDWMLVTGLRWIFLILAVSYLYTEQVLYTSIISSIWKASCVQWFQFVQRCVVSMSHAEILKIVYFEFALRLSSMDCVHKERALPEEGNKLGQALCFMPSHCSC